MPITKQAIKRMKQSEAASIRNKHYSSRMKSMIKLVLTYVHAGQMEKAKKALSETVKAIDMAAKKKLIHENNAARKKSRVQRAVNTCVAKEEVVTPKKVTKAKKVKVEKKVEMVAEKVQPTTEEVSEVKEAKEGAA